MSFFEGIISYIKLPARFLFGLCCVGLLLLFLPDSFLSKLHILPLRNEYGSYIGVATLACVVFFFVQLIPYITRKAAQNNLKFNRLRLLSSLSKEEKGLLVYCLNNNQQTVMTSLDDSAARALAHKGLLLMGSGTHDMFKWPFTVEPSVWEYLRYTSNRCLDGYSPYAPYIRPRDRWLNL